MEFYLRCNPLYVSVSGMQAYLTSNLNYFTQPLNFLPIHMYMYLYFGTISVKSFLLFIVVYPVCLLDAQK